MGRLLFIILSLTLGYAQSIPERCSSSINCKACHGHIVKDWEKSWHARSHIEKNEYFKKSLAHYAKRNYKSIEAASIECAECHNPRIGVTELKQYDDIAYAFNLKDKSSKLVEATHDDKIKEGINCIVCHKIASIEEDKNPKARGNSILTWLEEGTIGGPFADAKSHFHNSKQQSFFNNPDQLCLVCHQNMYNKSDFQIASTGEEFKKSSTNELCVDCHMSKKEMGRAATTPNTDGVRKKRMIRRHKFVGAHSSSILKKALDIKLRVAGENIEVSLYNPNPHNVPTGFGGRVLVVELHSFIGTQVEIERMTLSQKYYNKRDRLTIPHLAVKATPFEGVKAKSVKKLRFKRHKAANEVVVKVYYQLVSDEINSILELEEKRWQSKQLIKEKRLKL